MLFFPMEVEGLEIESISPGSGTVGTSVTIQGTHTAGYDYVSLKVILEQIKIY